MSTGRDDWQTPQSVFLPLDREFNFALDVAATRANVLCHMYLGPDHSNETCRDGLAKDWAWVLGSLIRTRACWCNPPYSRGLQSQFVAKAAAERKQGVTTAMLLPARTDTKAFHSHIWNEYEHGPKDGIEVRFLRGRLKFVGAPASAPFPSMVVIFRGAK